MRLDEAGKAERVGLHSGRSLAAAFKLLLAKADAIHTI